MSVKCLPKNNIDEKKRLGYLFPFFLFNCFVVWIFVIKQIMHLLVIIIVLCTSGSRMSSHSSPVPTTSMPKFPIPESPPGPASYGGFPQFLSVQQVVDVLEGSTAVLECRVTNLGSHHTVSWLRSSDISVLTVGGLVFSSDPRIAVVSTSMPGQPEGIWRLQIRQARVRDGGEYQCQVNSEPKESLDVTLVVRGKDDELIELNEEKEIYSVFKQFNIPVPTEPDIESGENIPLKESLDDTLVVREKDDELIDLNEDKEIYSVFKQFNIPIPSEPEIKFKENIPKLSHKQTLQVAANLSNINVSSSSAASAEETDLEIETFEGEKLQTVIQEIITNSESVPHPTASDQFNPKDNSKNPNSLLIPVVSLFIVVILIIVLGSIRGFYSRYVDKNAGPSRSRSRTGTIDSRKSSVSRRSEESVYSTSKRMRRKERELELERQRMMIYDEIRHKPRLSPLIEVIEPTPPLRRIRPIFLMTRLEIPGNSDESDYEADRSDETGTAKISDDEKLSDNTKVSENGEMSDHTSVPCGDNCEEAPKGTSYNTVRNMSKKLLEKNTLEQQWGEEESGVAEEERRRRRKLVDNINTYL